jgi:hypothetical protein
MTDFSHKDPLTDPFFVYTVVARAAGDDEVELIRSFLREPTEEEIRRAIETHVRERVENADEEALKAFVDSYFDFPNGASIEVVRRREL